MRLTAAVVQLSSGPDLERNLSRAAELIAVAARRGAELVVLPENFALLTDVEADKRAAAEPVPGQGPILSAMRAAARHSRVALVLGGMPERTAGGQRFHNTAVYLDPEGAITATYRKIHLFDVALPDGASYQESKIVEPGSEPVLAETPWGGLGLSICYDLRFPELYRGLAARGARLLSIPAAFTVHTGRDHWHVLLRARAIENLCFVLAAAQYGQNTPRRATYGHSLIVDPWGQVLAEVGDQEGVAVAELDLDQQDRLRRALPALGHRRL